MGTLVGTVISLGVLVFAIVAVVKAFTRRSRGWIITGSIGGLILAVISCFIYAFHRSAKSTASTARESAAALTPAPLSGGDLPKDPTMLLQLANYYKERGKYVSVTAVVPEPSTHGNAFVTPGISFVKLIRAAHRGC